MQCPHIPLIHSDWIKCSLFLPNPLFFCGAKDSLMIIVVVVVTVNIRWIEAILLLSSIAAGGSPLHCNAVSDKWYAQCLSSPVPYQPPVRVSSLEIPISLLPPFRHFLDCYCCPITKPHHRNCCVIVLWRPRICDSQCSTVQSMSCEYPFSR